ncbi:sialic acid-binding Ig-like lectin 16 isoform X2 [Alosa pseudoharengus]|uniref:sialic acid-binding Ig-like lectin 16 isoform X2 n=1 Tax=Alosa pseudoharengus TaxID=34774 RepID=UPI003F8B2127
MKLISMFPWSSCLVLTVLLKTTIAGSNVKYQTMKTCALEGSSVSIVCSYSYPKGHKVTATHWFKAQSLDKVTHDILQDHVFKDRVENLGDGTQSCTVRINNLRVEDSGTYWFSFETDHSEKKLSSSSGFTLSVTDLLVEVSPEVTVTEGEEVDLYCGSCILSEAPTYVWMKDGHILASLERTNLLLIDPARMNDTGNYTCQVKGHEATPSHLVRLTVSCKQQVQVKLPPGQVKEGEQLELTCDITCPVTSSQTFFKWSKDSRLLSDQNHRRQLVLDPVMAEDTGRYSCALAGQQELHSPAVEVLVQYSPKNTTAIVLGEPLGTASVTLTCSSDANPPVESYTWFKVNESTPVGSGQQYSITNIRPEDGGQYYCEAKNTVGSGRSPTLLVTLQGKADSPLPVVMGIVAAILVAIFVGIGVICGIKRRHRMLEGGTLDKAGDPGQSENTYSNMELKLTSSDYEDVTERGLNPTDSTYTALAFKSQSSEYETLEKARNTSNDYSDEPATGIYETLDDITKTG